MIALKEGPQGPEGVEKLGQQIDGVHQQTVKDELPTLGLNDLTPDQLGKLQSAVGSLDPNESLEDQGITLTWKTKPDVDAVGTSHGVAELTYTDNTGDTPQKRSTIIKIDVDVREDQTINRFVKKISDKPLTWSQANEEASNNNLNYDTSTFLDADGWTGSNLSWTLDRNKHYYDSKAIHLKQVKMQVVKDSNTAHQLFQQGNLDDAQITGTTAQGMQNDKNLKHLHRAGVYYLQLNMRKNRVFSNAKMRHALNLVLDKKQLARKVLADGSTPADTFVAPTLAKDQSTGVDFAKEMKPEETHNVAKAQKLWNEGLKEEGRKKADLTYYTYDQTINKNIAQFVQSQVETKLKNAKVEIHAVPAKNVQDNVMRGNFDMYLSLWLADYTDPMSDMDVLQSNNY